MPGDSYPLGYLPEPQAEGKDPQVVRAGPQRQPAGDEQDGDQIRGLPGPLQEPRLAVPIPDALQIARAVSEHVVGRLDRGGARVAAALLG